MAASFSLTKARSSSGGVGFPGRAWAMAWVMAIMTAAGVPWPLTSAMRMPHWSSGEGEKVIVIAAGHAQEVS